MNNMHSGINRHKKKALVLTLRGRLSGFLGESTGRMIHYWANVANNGMVLIDLSRLDFVDSLGMQAPKKASSIGNVAFCSPSPNVMQFMENANISPAVNTYDSIDEAIERLGLELSCSYEAIGERRRYPRGSICAPAKLTAIHGDHPVAFKSAVTNISLGGVLVEYLLREHDAGPFMFALGMPIAQLDLSALRKGLVVDGTLARLDSQDYQMGLGINFSDLAEPKREAIRDYMRESAGERLALGVSLRPRIDRQ